MTKLFNNSIKMPLLFIGHGSPMNSLAKNDFTKSLNHLALEIKKPKAILSISAHWLTEGTMVTEASNPRTIHDFHGFPKELFEIQYPAPGDIALAKRIIESIPQNQVRGDAGQWGLDHGTWSVLRHLYPEADIPVLQLSLNVASPLIYHFELGRQLSFLRSEGVLILGSGNIVHNLRKIDWDPQAQPEPWVFEFDEWVKENLANRRFEVLIQEFYRSSVGDLSVPTIEHYLPMLYILGAVEDSDQLNFIFEGIHHGSISMRSFCFG